MPTGRSAIKDSGQKLSQEILSLRWKCNVACNSGPGSRYCGKTTTWGGTPLHRFDAAQVERFRRV